MKTKYSFLVGVFAVAVLLLGNLSPATTPPASASTLGIIPTSNGNYQQWSTSGAGSAYTLVDESSCNGSTDYVYSTTSGQRESVGISLSSIPNSSIILDISIVPCASYHTSGPSSMSVFYRWNGTNFDSGTYSLGNSTPVDLNPANFYNLGYSKTSTSTLEVGATVFFGNVRLSRIAAVITYVTPQVIWQKCTTQCDIYVMNSDGTNSSNLTSGTSTSDEFDAQWSRDHSKIVFSTTRNGNADIYSMNADGSSVTQLTSDTAFETYGTFSPDGTHIAFSRSVSGKYQIFTMNADGTNVTQVTNNGYNNEEPAYSPDGTKIMYDTDINGAYDIYVMNANGSGATRLTTDSHNDRYPSWSLNGGKVTFASDRDGDEEVFTMNPDGTSQTQLTSNTTYADSDPVFYADGNSIYFASVRDGNPEIYAMSVDGTGQTRVTNDINLDAGPDW
jgi:tricorn protease-like protein